MPAQILPAGLAVIHSNRLESLKDLVVAWIQNHPLAPLEEEVILVQSNGIAQWLKMALGEADGLGICAAVAPQLPGRFLWRAYQIVLKGEEVPDTSPFEKSAVAWRLYRLLPGLLDDERFIALRQFLADDGDARKRHQLAGVLADLLDQYQVYRADWLRDWAEGIDQLRDAHGNPELLPPEQAWQPALWRAVLEDVPEQHRSTSRALLHERFLEKLESTPEQAANWAEELPRRIIVFGISSLPQQMVRALSALGQYCQVLLCVHNPCRYYWADIIEHRELLKASRRRQPAKPSMPALLAPEELHLHANPLLAAWGKQGRDYVRLLDEFDEPEHYRAWFQRIDLFEDLGEEGERSLLEQVQQAVLDLAPLPTDPAERLQAKADGSILFQIAHSPQREVEILHDSLLALFAESRNKQRPLLPRDIIVMVPDIDTYAPHISAVFGQIPFHDPRYIPFSLTDQSARGHNPMMVALESLLRLPESRFTVSDLLQWLDVPALRLRFNIDDGDLPLLHRWIQQAGIRWGLDEQQRESLGLIPGLQQNTWHFGLQRLLLGYAVGSGSAYQEIEPLDEVGGLNAALLGPLASLLERLQDWWQRLQISAKPEDWAKTLRQLLEDFFLPDNDRDQLTLERLEESLSRFEEVCAEVVLEEPLPLSVVREAWLSGVDEPTLTQRFLAGRVNFCTLLPMRAIPFQVVCLLGMNDGDYPRSQMPLSFDLMAQTKGYRPGDRSRREDDRYLFLEALLSARQRLYLSWVGRSAQDNSPRPASLLVGQLRDYLSTGWVLDSSVQQDGGQALLDALTVCHPLQAFSPRYFLPSDHPLYDARLFTYAAEWRNAHEGKATEAQQALAPLLLEAPISLNHLSQFLRNPVQAFFNYRLKIWFEDESSTSEDAEPFGFDRLEVYGLGDELLQAALAAPAAMGEAAFDAQLETQAREGRLPLAGFAQSAQDRYAQPAWAAYQNTTRLLAQWPSQGERALEIRRDYALKLTEPDTINTSVLIEDWLTDIRQNGDGFSALVYTRPLAIHDKQGKPKWHYLVGPWVKHLAACATGTLLSSFLVGPDGEIALKPIAAEVAEKHLADLAEAWYVGMSKPLPLACKTAFAWLSGGEKAEEAAQKTYEGDGFNFDGEGADAYLARTYSDYEQLRGQAEFEIWLGRIYQPLFEAIQSPDDPVS